MIIIVALIFILRAMTRMDNTATAEKPKDNAPYPVATDRQISSRVLLGSEGRVVIEHGGQRYLLRQTNAGKLISDQVSAPLSAGRGELARAADFQTFPPVRWAADVVVLAIGKGVCQRGIQALQLAHIARLGLLYRPLRQPVA